MTSVESHKKSQSDLRQHLTSGRLLARNTIWNLLGNGAPLLVAVACIPILIRELGKDRFGVLTLAWALIGYASFFDLGLGRALTQLVAHKLGAGNEDEIPSLAWTSLLLMILLGILGTAIILGISPWLIDRALNVPQSLRSDAVLAFRVLGLSVPFVITTAGLRGLLEAYQQFRVISVLRIPMGIFTFVGPLLMLPFSRNISAVVAILVVGRVVGWAAYFIVCLRVLPNFRRSLACDRSALGPLLSFGGWMTVSNIVSPVLMMLDRFLIGAMVSMTAVAYYASPYEVVTKFLMIPVALMGVMFPAFSTGFVQNRGRTSKLFVRSVKILMLALFPLMLFSVALAQDGLRLWLGADFAIHSFRVFQWLAVGVFLNSLALVPFSLLQGAGRPDWTAKLHLAELPIYMGLLFWMIRLRGIEGAAMAWTIRMAIDAIFLFILSKRLLHGTGRVHFRAIVLPCAAILTLGIAALLNGAIVKVIFLVGAILSFALVMWYRVLTPEERSLTQTYR